MTLDEQIAETREWVISYESAGNDELFEKQLTYFRAVLESLMQLKQLTEQGGGY